MKGHSICGVLPLIVATHFARIVGFCRVLSGSACWNWYSVVKVLKVHEESLVVGEGVGGPYDTSF